MDRFVLKFGWGRIYFVVQGSRIELHEAEMNLANLNCLRILLDFMLWFLPICITNTNIP